MLISISRMWRVIDLRKIIYAGVLVLFLGSAGLGAAWLEKDVTIMVDGKTIPLSTWRLTVARVLEDAGVAVGVHDRVWPALDQLVREGEDIEVWRAVPITLVVDGEKMLVQVPLPDVKQVLAGQGIKLNPEDRLESNLWNSEKDTYLKVIRVKEQIETREIPLDYNTILRASPEMLRGQRKVLQRGEQGLVRRKVLVKYEGQTVVAERLLDEIVLKEPMSQVIAYGTKPRWDSTSRGTPGGPDFRAKKEMVVEATAYTHTGNPTATGIYPYEGVVAVDPRVIPLGTKLFVEGYGFAQAQDTGGAIKGNRIDVFFDSYEKAMEWGRRQVKVYILED